MSKTIEIPGFNVADVKVPYEASRLQYLQKANGGTIDINNLPLIYWNSPMDVAIRNINLIFHLLAIEDGSANLYDVLDKATKNKDGSDKKRGGLTNLWRLWRFHYKPGIGDNLWSLYNVLTDWATHHQGTTSTSSNNLVALQTKASKEVKDLVVKDNLFRLAA